MPDARCTRGLMRNVQLKVCARAYRAAENIRHSLRNGSTAYNVLSPENGSFASVAPWEVECPQVHGRQRRCVRTTRLCRTPQPRSSSDNLGVHRSPPNVRDDGRRPSDQGGMVKHIHLTLLR
jgi:hypothetical protein